MNFSFNKAREIAEGLIEYDDPKIIIAAWQYLIDRNHIRRLDDWFQKSAKELIELGICWAPAQTTYYRKKGGRNDRSWYKMSVMGPDGKKMNTNNLENMIRDKLTDDDLISGLIEQDDVFEHLIDLIGETIDEWDQTERKWV